MAGAPQSSEKSFTASDLSAGLYLVIAVACNLFPSLAFQLVPGGDVSDKETTFIVIYLTTLPLSLTLTAIVFIWLRGSFDSDQERLFATGALLIVSGIFGLAFGSSQADKEFLYHVHGPPWVVIFAAAFYILLAYAVFYGAALFICAFLVSGLAAFWLHEKIDET